MCLVQDRTSKSSERGKPATPFRLCLPKTLRIEAIAGQSEPRGVDVGTVGACRRSWVRSVAVVQPNRAASFVTEEKPVGEWLQPVPDKLGVFRTVAWVVIADGKRKRWSLCRSTVCIAALMPSIGIFTHRDVGQKIARTETLTERSNRSLRPRLIGFLQPGDAEKREGIQPTGRGDNAGPRAGAQGAARRSGFRSICRLNRQSRSHWW